MGKPFLTCASAVVLLVGGGTFAAVPTMTAYRAGDAIAVGSVRVPTGAAPGVYELQVGILGETDDRPKVKLAIAGADPEGWYPMGKVRVLAPDGASGR